MTIIPKLNIFKEYLKKYERYVGITSILLGFVWDFFTFSRPDQLLGNVILLSYLVLAGFGIVLLSLYKKRGEITPIILLALVQFAFGNIAGSFLFLYGKSGTFEGSSLFLIVLGILLVGNEFMREKYSKINLHISIWYFFSLLYLTFIIPMIFGEISDFVFLLSGAMSLVVVSLLLFILYLASKNITKEIGKVALYISGIFIAFNSFYFLNIIPPVPLSLQEIGIYHLVEKINNKEYRVIYEKPEWFSFFYNTSKVFNKQPNESTYCFSSIFAPVKLSTVINHRWEYYDEVKSGWQLSSIISFPIEGGRENGYRGYSEKSSLRSGLWRCSVETTSGALIGRITFNVLDSNTVVPLVVGRK